MKRLGYGVLGQVLKWSLSMGLALGCASSQAWTPVFVLNSLDSTVSVIDPSDWHTLKTILTGKEPHHLYLTPDERSMIVANAGGDSLTFVDPKTAEVQRVVRGTLDPYQLRFSPDMKWFVTLANRLDHVDIYRWDGQTLNLVKRVQSGKTPSHLWIDSKSTTVYASMQDSDELVSIDLATQSIKWRVKTGSAPADVFGTSTDQYLLVALTGAQEVQVYDITQSPATLVKTIPTGKGAHSFRAMGDGQHVLVSNRAANTVSVIDLPSLTVERTFAAPGGPDDMEISVDRKTVYVSSRWIKKLSIIDLASGKLLKQVSVGKSPHGVWTLEHAPRQ
jgi:DNA-binding beta-propeller fold protein YncE